MVNAGAMPATRRQRQKKKTTEDEDYVPPAEEPPNSDPEPEEAPKRGGKKKPRKDVPKPKGAKAGTIRFLGDDEPGPGKPPERKGKPAKKGKPPVRKKTVAKRSSKAKKPAAAPKKPAAKPRVALKRAAKKPAAKPPAKKKPAAKPSSKPKAKPAAAPKPKPKPKPAAAPKPPAAPKQVQKGETVEARWSGDGKMYEAVVLDAVSDTKVRVPFTADDVTDLVPVASVKKLAKRGRGKKKEPQAAKPQAKAKPSARKKDGYPAAWAKFEEAATAFLDEYGDDPRASRDLSELFADKL